MIWPIVIFSACVVTAIHADNASHGEKLHDHMTKEEIESVFNVKHDDIHKVEYEVVPIYHKDDGQTNVKLRAFNQNYDLYLEKNNHVLIGEETPVYIAKTNPSRGGRSTSNSITYTRIKFPLPDNFKLYHDMQNRAALSVHKDTDNKVHLNGIIGDDVIVRSVPTRVHQEVLSNFPTLAEESSFSNHFKTFSNSPFFSGGFSDGNYQTTQHIIIKPQTFDTDDEDEDLFFGQYQNKVNKIKQQWLHGKDIDDDSFDPFIDWPGSNVYLPWRPSARPPISWRPQTSRPYNPYPWRPQTHEPYTWRPPTHAPFTWRPQTKEPFTWRPPTHAPYTWRPPTHAPYTWRPPTHAPFTWRPQTKEPFTWRPQTKEPFTWRPQTKEPFTWRPPTKAPFTWRPPTKAPRPSDPSDPSNSTVYPELLITVDYDTFRTHGSNIESVAKYMAAFWNAVDLRYREMSNPKVRLNIAGLIIPQQRDGTSYFELNRGNAQTLLADATLSSIGKHFVTEDEFPKNTYDIVVGVTQRNLGSVDQSGKLSDSITGIATFEAACLVESGNSVALVRDKGGFNGITTAAHELAHSMGAPHDGPESKNVPGGPCPWNDGYLMSYQRQDAKGMHWSHCSMTAMRNYFKSDRAKCLWNKPNPGKPHPKILPGRLLSRDEQCQKTMGRNADRRYTNECAVLWCDGMSESRPPAEGTSCGNGMICLDAHCVKDPELAN